MTPADELLEDLQMTLDPGGGWDPEKAKEHIEAALKKVSIATYHRCISAGESICEFFEKHEGYGSASRGGAYSVVDVLKQFLAKEEDPEE
jgi:hypothetical protein